MAFGRRVGWAWARGAGWRVVAFLGEPYASACDRVLTFAWWHVYFPIRWWLQDHVGE